MMSRYIITGQEITQMSNNASTLVIAKNSQDAISVTLKFVDTRKLLGLKIVANMYI